MREEIGERRRERDGGEERRGGKRKCRDDMRGERERIERDDMRW